MAGITRINIVSDWDDWRTQMADDLAPVANDVYRELYSDLGITLDLGEEIVECSREEALSRYDWQEGIDVILRFVNGGKATLQEKFLTFGLSTATFEEQRGNGEEGAWYYCTAQYYFVGYARKYRRERPDLSFQDWMMLDLPAMKRADAQGRIPWRFNENGRDGRRSTFRYVDFDRIPLDCIISRQVNLFQMNMGW